MTTVISVENLSKAYRLGQIGTGTLKNDLKVWWAKAHGKPNPFSRIVKANSANQDRDTIWALENVSLDVQQGEVLGVIGRNGAGKSTLLKILSRITAPTSGLVKVKGNIASLLEVGTGFHSDLTGRENIFLNGAILGMSQREIQRKFGAIVDFSGVELFIDTPVKRYSSGMFVRLAFAVAAYLEPEILLVDEVLAVGDVEFQKKCLGKMGEVAREGRTVLFVSHNLTSIENLCPRTIWIDQGGIKRDGATKEIVTEYLSRSLPDEAIINLENFTDRSGNGQARIIQVEFRDANGYLNSSVRMGDSITIRMKVQSNNDPRKIMLGVQLHTEDGVFVTDFRTNYVGFDPGVITEVSKIFDLIINPILLFPRTYIISPWIMDPYGREDYDWVKYAAKFTVEVSDFLGTGFQFSSALGIIYMPSQWKCVDTNEQLT